MINDQLRNKCKEQHWLLATAQLQAVTMQRYSFSFHYKLHGFGYDHFSISSRNYAIYNATTNVANHNQYNQGYAISARIVHFYYLKAFYMNPSHFHSAHTMPRTTGIVSNWCWWAYLSGYSPLQSNAWALSCVYIQLIFLWPTYACVSEVPTTTTTSEEQTTTGIVQTSSTTGMLILQHDCWVTENHNFV